MTAEATQRFFELMPVRAKKILPGPTAGILRIDLTEPGHTEHWFLTLAIRSVTVSRQGGVQDAVFAASPALFDRLVRGEAQVISAVFRNEATFAGNGILILALRRFFPSPPGIRDPREAVLERSGGQR